MDPKGIIDLIAAIVALINVIINIAFKKIKKEVKIINSSGRKLIFQGYFLFSLCTIIIYPFSKRKRARRLYYYQLFIDCISLITSKARAQ